jgi:hypothetical protein
MNAEIDHAAARPGSRVAVVAATALVLSCTAMGLNASADASDDAVGVEQELHLAAGFGDFYARVFAGERRDESWASATEAAAKDIFATAPALEGAALTTIECRQSMCLMNVQSGNTEANDNMMAYISSVEPFMAGGFFRVTDDSTEQDVRAAVYFARQGHSLPSPTVR